MGIIIERWMAVSLIEMYKDLHQVVYLFYRHFIVAEDEVSKLKMAAGRKRMPDIMFWVRRLVQR